MKNTMAMKLICMLLCVVMLGAMLAGCASGKQETAQAQIPQPRLRPRQKRMRPQLRKRP